MSSEWITVKLGTLISINSKSITSKSNLKTIEYIDTSSVTENQFEIPQILNIEDAPSRAKRLVSKGDTIISTVRPIQKHYGFIQDCKQNTVVSTGFAVVTPKKISPAYLYYFLTQEDITIYLNSIAESSTTTFPAFKPELLAELDITLPKDIKAQEDIGQILLNLENKILYNTKTNNTLETIAKTLFKSWFVDFDPVKAKIAAKEQGQDPQLAAMIAISGKTAEQIAQLPAEKRKELAVTADLFPDEMVESELGLIPRGWKVENLSSVTTQIKRGITPKYIENDGVIVLNQKCIRNHTLNFEFARRHNNKLKSINDSFVEIGDILVNSTGVGTLGRVAIVRRLPEKTIIDTHVTVVRADEDKINKTYLGINLLGREMEIELLAEGTTGQTELKRSLLEVLPLMTPQKDLQNLFAQILTPQLESYAKNEKENSTLIQIRDTLLPRLLSGEIEIH